MGKLITIFIAVWLSAKCKIYIFYNVFLLSHSRTCSSLRRTYPALMSNLQKLYEVKTASACFFVALVVGHSVCDFQLLHHPAFRSSAASVTVHSSTDSSSRWPAPRHWECSLAYGESPKPKFRCAWVTWAKSCTSHSTWISRAAHTGTVVMGAKRPAPGLFVRKPCLVSVSLAVAMLFARIAENS